MIGAFIGCENDKPTEPEGLPDYLYPLHSSSFWVYDVESYENDSLLYRSSDTTMTDSTLIWGAEEWFGFKGINGVFWRNGIEGVWRLIFRPEMEYGMAEKYYEYPTVPGDMWYVASDDDSVSVVSLTESVEVPAGTFENCYYYRIVRSDRSRRVSVWIMPGIGIVQQSELMIVGGDTLRSFTRLRQY
ncbi:MAG TPA: hypothetical protein ENL08_05485 [Bacteroidetes bacterium]|nr:hypothetical protein [Bacteroidota bacterium]